MDMPAAFMADIVANPDDDTPRLVYADWLEDDGDPARAEFIRLQCRLARMDRHDLGRYALGWDEHALLWEHEKAWCRPLGHVDRVKFRRGFPHRFSAWCSSFVEEGEAILVAAPTLREYRVRSLAIDWDALIACPTLLRLSALDVGLCRSGPAVIQALASSPHVANLRSLNVSEAQMQGEGAEALASSPHLANLRRLDLSKNKLGGPSVLRLLTSPALPHLESLDLDENALFVTGITSLARSPRAARLRELSIHEAGGDDEDAHAFASGEWPALRKLTLRLGRMGAAGMAALGRCAFPNLRDLRLEHAPLQSSAALLSSPHLPRLERLHLDAPSSADALEALAGSPMLAGLLALVVKVREAPGLAVALRDTASAGLRELEIHGQHPGDGAVAFAVAEAGHLVNLRRLVLYNTALTTDGVAALAGAAHLSGLVELVLSHNGALDDGAARALAASPHLGGLRRLVVDGNYRMDKAPLVERFGKGVVKQ